MTTYTVVRGQIEKGTQVIATKGDVYAPENQDEENRLLDAGVIAPQANAEQKSEADDAEDPEEEAAEPAQKATSRKRSAGAK